MDNIEIYDTEIDLYWTYDYVKVYRFKIYFREYTNVYRTNYIESTKVFEIDSLTPSESDLGEFWKPYIEYTNKLKRK
jgi:hypothetical protein